MSTCPVSTLYPYRTYSLHYPVTRRYYFLYLFLCFIFFCCTGNSPHSHSTSPPHYCITCALFVNMTISGYTYYDVNPLL